MKVVTFNIRCADDKDGHSIEERFPRVKKLLSKYGADIIGFQEVTPKWLKYLKEYEQNGYEIFNKYRALDNHESVPIMWNVENLECIDKGYFWFSDTPWIESMGKDTYGCKRICMWVHMKEKRGEDFFLFNVHLGFGVEEQTASVDLVLKTAKRLDAERVIIMGDFNMEMESPAYQKMTEVYADANMMSIQYMDETYHGYGKEKGEHIDYCFISENTVNVASGVVLTETFEGKYPSDHYGLSFELELHS